MSAESVSEDSLHPAIVGQEVEAVIAAVPSIEGAANMNTAASALEPPYENTMSLEPHLSEDDLLLAQEAGTTADSATPPRSAAIMAAGSRPDPPYENIMPATDITLPDDYLHPVASALEVATASAAKAIAASELRSEPLK